MTAVEGAEGGRGTVHAVDPGDGHVPAGPARRARRTVALPPEPGSPARARGVLRRTLRETGRLDCLDAAELACTELVTNAVLHAHSTVVVTVDVAAEVRVEVRDASGSMPRRRHHDPQATTGRGLALVAALTDDYGVTNVGPDGKTVWFTVGGRPERTEDELLAAWETTVWDLDDPDLAAVAATGAAPGHRVRLLGLPSALWLAARQHHDALLREMALYLARHDDVAVDVAGTDRARFLLSGAVGAAVEQQRRAASASEPARGDVRHAGSLPWSPQPMDLDLVVPADLGPDFAAMQDTLDRAEGLARDGVLLAHPGLPEVVAVRDWACEQIVAQVAGLAPSRWPGTDLERFDRAGAGERRDPVRASSGSSGPDLAAVTAARGWVAAADVSNRILAVSGPLALLLGWDAEELVGRRIVALIPHRLREAHVAGFTRHQSTGEVRVLGVPLTVPVLRADGSEVTCRLVIEHVPTAAGRTAYLATFTPQDERADAGDSADDSADAPVTATRTRH